jgi:hypothetical protein
MVRYLTILDGLIDTFPCFARNLLNVRGSRQTPVSLPKEFRANSTEVSTNMKKGIQIQK